MKNFIFKSDNKSDLHKMLFNKLEIIQSELRHQRLDHVLFKSLLEKLFVELNLQKQADSYYQETSHQTELETSPIQDPHDLD